jgi:hypothetical protein
MTYQVEKVGFQAHPLRHVSSPVPSCPEKIAKLPLTISLSNDGYGPGLSVRLPGMLARSVALPHNALSLRRSFAPQAPGAITVQGEEYTRP